MRRYGVRVSHPVYGPSVELVALHDSEVAVEMFSCDEEGEHQEPLGVASVTLADGKLVATAVEVA